MKTNRDTLVSIAFRLFLTKGYQQTSMQDLARTSGLSKGAFHHYFPRKQDILDACLQRFFLYYLPDPDQPADQDIAQFAQHCAARYAKALCELTAQGIPLAAFQAFLWAQTRDAPDEMKQHQASILARFAQGLETRVPGHGTDLARQLFAVIEGTGVLLSIDPPANPDATHAAFQQAVFGFFNRLGG